MNQVNDFSGSAALDILIWDIFERNFKKALHQIGKEIKNSEKL